MPKIVYHIRLKDPTFTSFPSANEWIEKQEDRGRYTVGYNSEKVKFKKWVPKWLIRLVIE